MALWLSLGGQRRRGGWVSASGYFTVVRPLGCAQPDRTCRSRPPSSGSAVSGQRSLSKPGASFSRSALISSTRNVSSAPCLSVKAVIGYGEQLVAKAGEAAERQRRILRLAVLMSTTNSSTWPISSPASLRTFIRSIVADAEHRVIDRSGPWPFQPSACRRAGDPRLHAVVLVDRVRPRAIGHVGPVVLVKARGVFELLRADIKHEMAVLLAELERQSPSRDGEQLVAERRRIRQTTSRRSARRPNSSSTTKSSILPMSFPARLRTGMPISSLERKVWPLRPSAPAAGLTAAHLRRGRPAVNTAKAMGARPQRCNSS